MRCSVVVDANAQALQQLFSRPPAGLHGLTVKGLALQQSFVDQLAGLTKLTSLQLVGAMCLGVNGSSAWLRAACPQYACSANVNSDQNPDGSQ